MKQRLDALLERFRRLSDEPPGDLTDILELQPVVDELPPPWMTWTLIGLVRHHRRQQWVAEIIKTRLQGDPKRLAAMGAFGHPDEIARHGSVPGMPEWEYYFHGNGCRLSHKVDGIEIDVDFMDNTADYFDTFFYENYLKSLRRPEPPERRLLELHPTADTITLTLQELLIAGGLTPLPGRDANPYRLSDEVLAIASDVDAFCIAWENVDRRAALAGSIGDWPAAEKEVSEIGALPERVTPYAAQCRAEWRRRLVAFLDQDFKGAYALQALADLQAPELDAYLMTTLLGPPGGKISAALEVIDASDDPRWCEPAYQLFTRVHPEGQIPEPRNWMNALKFLLRKQYRLDVVVPALSRAGGTEIAEAVLLSLENAPELTLPLIRKTFQSGVPGCRTEVAAILALINAPWSRRELLRALDSSDDQHATADARAALLELCDPELEQAVLAWEERNPHENEVGSYIEVNGRQLGPFYSMSELSLKHKAAHVQYEMQQLFDRVQQVKQVVPPETL